MKNTDHPRPFQLRDIGLYLMLILGTILAIFPFLWMISTSLKGPVEVLSVNPTLLPVEWRWQNYPDVFNFLPTFGRMYFNTAFRTVTIVVGQLLFSAMAAFAFARLDFPGKNFLFLMVLGVLMIPGQVTLIPNFILFSQIGWVNNYLGLIVPSMFSAVGVFLFRQYFLSMPQTLFDAALIDGCTSIGMFWRVGLPLAQNALVSFGIFSTLWAWNDFLWPLILTNTEDMYLLSVGIGMFQGQFQSNFALMMSAASMATVPILILFVILQKRIIDGIAMTGLKT